MRNVDLRLYGHNSPNNQEKKTAILGFFRGCCHARDRVSKKSGAGLNVKKLHEKEFAFQVPVRKKM